MRDSSKVSDVARDLPSLRRLRRQPGPDGSRFLKPLSSDSVNVFTFASWLIVNENHPVLTALQVELRSLRALYERQPDERSRYRLVRHEQRMAQWIPPQVLSA